jgi:hypothetical protein
MTEKPLTPEEEAGGGPIAGLADLRDVAPPPSLVPAVMRRIAEPAPVTFWQWLRKPRRFELRLSPLSFASAAAIVVLAVGLLSLPRLPGARPPAADRATAVSPAATGPTATPAPAARAGDVNEVVLVRFVLMVKGARKVAVAGDFNGWNPEATPLDNADGRGSFTATVPLPRGDHQYMFVVDGEWVTDPAAAERRPDGFGRENAVLRL